MLVFSEASSPRASRPHLDVALAVVVAVVVAAEPRERAASQQLSACLTHPLPVPQELRLCLVLLLALLQL